MIDRVVELITRHEGLRLKTYLCPAGKLTIGVGRNLEENGISEDEAALMLLNDLAWVEAALNKNLPWWSEMGGARRGALVDMVFNLGWPRFSNFRRMIIAMQLRDYKAAADEMLDSRWAKQVGSRATELSSMMRHDEWPEGV